jgi:ribose transport system substrate-binding protein
MYSNLFFTHLLFEKRREKMKKWTKTIALLLIVALSLSAFTGCASQPAQPAESTTTEAAAATDASAPAPENTEPAVADKTYKFAIVYSIAVDFFDTVTSGAENAIAENGKNIELIVKAPDKGDINQQIEIMENLITMGVDGIAIGPSDSDALTPYIDKAVEAGIPVITFDTEAPNSKQMGYIGTDNYKAGRLLGEAVGKLNPDAKVICTISVPTQLGLQQRLKGAQDVWAESYPNVQLLDTRSSGGDPAVTLSNIEDMVKAYPDFDVLIGIDAQGGPAAVSAWKALGLDKKTVVFDDLPAVVQGIRDGQITVAISQFEYQWGAEIVNKLWDLTHGTEIPSFTEITPVALTSENIDQYFPAK